MNVRLRLLAIVLMGLLAISSVSVAWAFPPLPSSFYGTVKLSGANPPVGTSVSAWIGGVKYVQVQTSLYGGNSVYSLIVPGDDTGTPVIDGGREGDIISFKIDEQLAAQTGVWHSGSNLQLDLTSAIPRDQTPPVTKAAVSGATTSCALESKLYTGAGALVTLTANEPASNRYRVNNNVSGPGVWRTYGGPFVVSAEGVNTIEYAATDTAGNVEQTRQLAVQVTTFPQNPILDLFNRGNGALGSNWAGSTGTTAYRITDKHVAVVAGGVLYWKSGDVPGTTQEAYVTLTNGNAQSHEQDLLLKVQGGNSPNWTKGVIKVRYDAHQQAVHVETYQPGRSNWTIYADTPTTMRNGDQLGARAMADGNVRVYRSCVLIGITDTKTRDGDFFATRGGRVGLWFIDAKGTEFDNFGGGATR